MESTNITSSQTPPSQTPSSQTPSSYQPDAPALTTEELNAALSAKMIQKFPKITRHKNDPSIQNQQYANVSFMLLKEAKNGVCGFVKVRGVWGDDEVATRDAKRLIKEVDSTSIIHLAPVGFWVPVTNNEAFSQDQLDVKMRETDMALRDEAAKEVDSKNKQQQREIEERKRELKERGDIDDPTSLDYYTKKRVTQLELKKVLVQGREKLKTLKKSLRKLENEIITLNNNNPTYLDKWLDNYNKARKNVGLNNLTETELSNIEIVGTVDEDMYDDC